MCQQIRTGRPAARSGAAAPHPLPVHVRTIRIDAVETAADGGTPAALRVHGVLEDRRPRGVPDWLQHDGDVIHYYMDVILTVAWPELVIAAVD